MPTYKAQDGIDFATRMVKGCPTNTLDVRTCDMVSSEMWTAYPWFVTKTNITAGTIPLVNGTQDYTAPTNIYRLLKCSLVCTSTTPHDSRELDVAQELDVNLRSSSPMNIKIASYQAGVQKLRLETASQISSGETWEINGEYQTNPTKIADLSTTLWFQDQYFMVFVEGLIYWAYRFADDPRAGGQAVSPDGRIGYSGQYAAFRAGIERMKQAEDFGGVDGIFPSENLASGRDDITVNIYGVV